MATQETLTPDRPTEGGRARWTWLATLGFLLVAAGPLLMVLGGILVGGFTPDEAGFFGVTFVVALVAAFLVSRFGLWSKIVGILLALGLLGSLFWTAFGLFAPNSFLDFTPGLLVPPGAIIAIVGCIAAIVAGRRGNLESAPVRGERKAIRVILGVIGALALVSLVLTFVSRSSVDEGAEVATTVVAADFEYPDTVEVSGGDSILVRNDDGFLHTFTVEELDIDVALGPKSEELVEIPEGAGTYTFVCVPHTSNADEPGEDDMAGELIVQ